ncbi:anaerobic C4-dicarboxylate transporter family protein [Shigella flexneri]
MVLSAIINSPRVGLVEKPLMNTTNAILIIMLSVATLTTVICKVDTDNVLNSSTFKAGMSACICILGFRGWAMLSFPTTSTGSKIPLVK